MEPPGLRGARHIIESALSARDPTARLAAEAALQEQQAPEGLELKGLEPKLAHGPSIPLRVQRTQIWSM